MKPSSKDKKIKPAIFKDNRTKTKKHDDFIKEFGKDSKKLKETIKKCLDLKSKNGKKELFIAEDEKIYNQKPTPIDIDNCDEFRRKEGKENLIQLEKDDGNVLGINGHYKKCKRKINSKIDIIEWEPESPVIKRGSYYVGSVDLFVKINVSTQTDLIIDKKKDWVWENFSSCEDLEKRFFFEFKPKINSFTETLRQIKVYEKLLYDHRHKKKTHPILITNQKIDDFKDIFESQNVRVFQW